MTGWADLFPEEDFGFRLTLRRETPAAFFAPTAEGAAGRTERRNILDTDPVRYAIVPARARAAWAEMVAATAGWMGRLVSSDPVVAGGELEPDVVLLVRDAAGVFRVAGGVVVFPSHWALADKIGRTLLETHGVVPGLNGVMGAAIDRYLDRIKPGLAAGRSNWGLAATDARNLHPATHPPRLTADLGPDQMWLRVERQLLTPLPETGAILFGIRIERFRLDEVWADAAARRGFLRALRSMPDAVARYKGMAEVRRTLLQAWSAEDGD